MNILDRFLPPRPPEPPTALEERAAVALVENSRAQKNLESVVRELLEDRDRRRARSRHS